MEEQLTMEQYLHEMEEGRFDDMKEDTADEPVEPIAFETINEGDTVRIVVSVEDATSIEDEAYFEQYGGKTGKVVRVVENNNPICFEVDTGKGRNGLFYREQLSII